MNCAGSVGTSVIKVGIADIREVSGTFSWQLSHGQELGFVPCALECYIWYLDVELLIYR